MTQEQEQQFFQAQEDIKQINACIARLGHSPFIPDEAVQGLNAISRVLDFLVERRD